MVIEAAGLNKERQVQFRLTSLQKYVHNNHFWLTLTLQCLLLIHSSLSPPSHPLPFTAHLVHGSHPDMTVFPTSGELTPINGQGTLFIITYTPQKYGHRAKLVVQVNGSEGSVTCGTSYTLRGDQSIYHYPLIYLMDSDIYYTLSNDIILSTLHPPTPPPEYNTDPLLLLCCLRPERTSSERTWDSVLEYQCSRIEGSVEGPHGDNYGSMHEHVICMMKTVISELSIFLVVYEDPSSSLV